MTMLYETDYLNENIEPLLVDEIKQDCIFCWKSNTCGFYGVLTDISKCPYDQD